MFICYRLADKIRPWKRELRRSFFYGACSNRSSITIVRQKYWLQMHYTLCWLAESSAAWLKGGSKKWMTEQIRGRIRDGFPRKSRKGAEYSKQFCCLYLSLINRLKNRTYYRFLVWNIYMYKMTLKTNYILHVLIAGRSFGFFLPNYFHRSGYD